MRELERDLPTPTNALSRPASTPSMPPLAILGEGRVGGSLARAARAGGLDVRSAGRTGARSALRGVEAVILCVPDAEIEAAAATCAEAIPPLRLVGHTSGATELAALGACGARGASVFSLHPLQTIPDAQTDLTAAPCAVAGSDELAVAFASELAERLGMRPFTIAEEHRAAYHAAAAIASNFLVALEESAASLLEQTGVADARELLAPLVLRSAANWAEHGAAALTGPIARGDEATVARHREALGQLAPELLRLYEVLAERTEVLANVRDEAER